MANPPLPDPSTLTNWEDAFLYPLPTVHKLEQQLRQNITSNKEKLRSLVGNSYRDLLGTAERIVEMDEQMSVVEGNLADIGKRCNARALERIVANETRMRRAREENVKGRHAAVAQTKVLQSSLGFMGRVVRDGGDALQGAKVLVLARLLHKSVSETSQTVSALDVLRKKLGGLRKKLLAYIERVLIKPDVDVGSLAHTLAAFALVTSSTPKEVLRHFLQVRFGQLEASVESMSETEILQMLDLYSRTLLETRELFPRRFADVLSSLAKVPLLQDDQLRSVSELNLDIYGSWIAENVRAFTPCVRHDQVSTSDVAEALASWTKQAQESLLQGIELCLKGQHNANAVLEIRRKVVSKHMSLNSKLRNESHSQAVQKLRRTFLQRLEELLLDVAQSLDISLDVEAAASTPSQNLWTMATSSFDSPHSAASLRKNIVRMRHSRSEDIDRATKKLDSFLHQLNDFWSAADAMRTTKWDDVLDFELDDLDDSEELHTGLTKEDPEELQRALRDAAKEALKRVYDKIKTASTESQAGPKFLIRVLRETDHCARSLGSRLPVGMTDLRDDAIAQNLHRKVASDVSRSALDALVIDFKQGPFVAVSLWEAKASARAFPALPVQPSPGSFRFLMSLHRDMTNAGNDLWSPACIGQVKSYVHNRLIEELGSYDFDHEPIEEAAALSNGHHGNDNAEEKRDESTEHGGQTENEERQDNPTIEGDKTGDVVDPKAKSKSRKRERRLQRLFDTLYLQHALSGPPPRGQALSSLVESLSAGAELEEAALEVLRKNALDYWTRTHLLFGLLASDR